MACEERGWDYPAAGILHLQTEGEIIYYVAIAAWQMLLEGEPQPGRVQSAHLEQAEQANLKLLEELQAQSPENATPWLEAMTQNYPQPHILMYILESITEESDRPDEDIRRELHGVAVFYLKTILDALLLTLPPEER